MHRSDEDDSHAVVAHRVFPTRAVGVKSTDPKLVPSTVKRVLPDGGAFFAPVKSVRTGESYVQTLSRAPDKPAICAVTENPKPAPAAAWQSIAVPETHAETVHKLPLASLSVALSRMVGVGSARPKLVPTSVAIDPPPSGAFGCVIAVVIGAS